MENAVQTRASGLVEVKSLRQPTHIHVQIRIWTIHVDLN